MIFLSLFRFSGSRIHALAGADIGIPVDPPLDSGQTGIRG